MVDISDDSRQMDTQLTATANDGPAAWSFTRMRETKKRRDLKLMEILTLGT